MRQNQLVRSLLAPRPQTSAPELGAPWPPTPSTHRFSVVLKSSRELTELMLLGSPPSPSSASSSGSGLVFTHTGKNFSFSWGCEEMGIDCEAGFGSRPTRSPTPPAVRILWGLGSPRVQGTPADLQGPLVQGAVLALDPVPGAPLQAGVLGPCEDGAVLPQTLGGRVLGAGEHLWTHGVWSLLLGLRHSRAWGWGGGTVGRKKPEG